MSSVLDFNDLLPSYADLPMEIILHIFGFLDHSSLQAAGSACRRWREALYDTDFNRRTVVHFMRVCLSDSLLPARVFLKSERPYSDFIFEEVTFGHVTTLMTHLGRTARDVTFDSIDIDDKEFYILLKQLPNLHTLRIIRCSSLFMSGCFMDKNDDRCVGELSLSSIRTLSLRYNQYLSDAILLRLTSLMRAIESLDMAGCHIAYHNAVQRRFYPNENLTPSESILTFKFILHVLGQHCVHLRELNLSSTLIGAQGLLALSELNGSGLQLQRLHLASCRQLTPPSLKSFLQTQPLLVQLDLSDTCVNDEAIEVLIESMPHLQDLQLVGCKGITNRGAILLGSLKYLRKLNISRCANITTEGITLGIAHATNCVMRELYMAYLKICEEAVKAVAQNMPELRILYLNHCINAVTDDSVQAIIKHLRWLRRLSLESCFKITDAALTGIDVEKLKPASRSSLEGFHPSVSSEAELESLNGSLGSPKISLRSKAEQEIVRDANRKKAILAAYEMNLINESDIENSNIQQMRGLRLLNLKDCTRISDVSLKYGLKFSELRTLSLSNCQQISLFGMESLVVNCPALEELNLSDCDNINDKTIQVITAKLPKLRALYINGCAELTDHSLDAILLNCKCLTTLSIYNCRRIMTDIEERMAQVPTLRDLNTDSASAFDNMEIFRLKKRFDY